MAVVSVTMTVVMVPVVMVPMMTVPMVSMVPVATVPVGHGRTSAQSQHYESRHCQTDASHDILLQLPATLPDEGRAGPRSRAGHPVG